MRLWLRWGTSRGHSPTLESATPNHILFPLSVSKGKQFPDSWHLRTELTGKAPVRNTLLTDASYSPSPCNLHVPLQSWVWQTISTIPESGRRTQENQKFTAIPGYWPSSRLAWTLWDPHLKQQSKTIVLIREDFYNRLLPVFCWHLSGKPRFLPSQVSCAPLPPKPSWISWPY